MKLYLSAIMILIFAVGVFAQTDRDKGIALYQKGDYAGAITLLESAVKTDDKDRDAWLFLGMSRARTGDKKNARKAFDTGTVLPADSSYFDQQEKTTSMMRPAYTDEARANRTSGVVKLAAEFGTDGKIGFIFPVKTLPFGLTESAIKAAVGIKFEPARKNGEAVTSIRIIEHNFSVF